MPRARWFSQFLTISVWFSIDAAASPSPLSSRASRPRPVFPFYPMARLPRALFVSHYSLASLLHRLSRCRPRFLVAVLVETMRVRFHNIEQSFISGFEGRGCTRGGKEIEQERESKTWDNYSMLPEPRHAGWILPVWLLKIIGSSHRERKRERKALCTRVYAVYARVCECERHGRMTVVYLYVDSCTWRLWISTWGRENTEREILGFHQHASGYYIRCTYLHKHSPPSKWTTWIRRGRVLLGIVNSGKWRDKTWRNMRCIKIQIFLIILSLSLSCEKIEFLSDAQ